MASALRKVLVLGSGFTAGPLVEYLTRDGKVAVTVASNVIEQAQRLAEKFKNTSAVELDVYSESNLSMLVGSHELVVSNVLHTQHTLAAKQCIKHRKSLVTSSYVTSELQEFHKPAMDAGITLMNEVGVDPGIDHMLAMECFDEVHSNGGKVVSFESWCGGLPHPDYANNPLRYKFSWSPKGVLLAALNQGKYKRDNQIFETAPGQLMAPENLQSFSHLHPKMDFDGYFNRNSLNYIDIYGIPEAQTVIRGTLRYKGTCKIFQGLNKMGLLSTKEHQRFGKGATSLVKWRDLLAMLVSKEDIKKHFDIRSSVYQAVSKDDHLFKSIEELRLLSDDPVQLIGSPLDTLCAYLERLLAYEPGERDAIFLHHFIGIEWPDKQIETRHIDLTMYGESNGDSAMAQTVGKPTAIAAKMILTGEIKKYGIVIPTAADIYKPMLKALKQEGIEPVVSKSIAYNQCLNCRY